MMLMDAVRQQYMDTALEAVGRLATLPEPDMRTTAFAELLSKYPALRAIWTLEALIRAVLRKKTAAVTLYGGLVDPRSLTDALSDGQLDAMVQAGRDEHCVAAMQWLYSSGTPSDKAEPEPDRLVEQSLRHLTLGDRRARARRATGDELRRLAVDPDPGVITNLLGNPRTNERLVLTICSRRPTVSAALEAVLFSRRWGQRYGVRLALVQNPFLAERLAVNLLPFLTRKDLINARDDEAASPTLRLAAQRLLDLPRD